MLNFANQCLDLAKSILSHNIHAIQEDGTVCPIDGEVHYPNESGHAAIALGEYFRATNQTTLHSIDLIDLAARCITAQAFSQEEGSETGFAYASMGLLAFGNSKERNPVWERLMEETRKELDKKLLIKADHNHFLQTFHIVQSVTRFSMGFSKKDETNRLIEKFIETINTNSSGGFVDSSPENFGGCFNIDGVSNFIIIRQALQLHADVHLKDRKLPSLRTYVEKYLKLLPDIVRTDGLGWCYGKGIGAYGQMHCITLILQALRDNWISEEQKPLYQDILRRLFYFFFVTYVDQEHGFLVIRDNERSTSSHSTTRIANFDAARYLCQWSRLAKSIGTTLAPKTPLPKTTGRYVSFSKSAKKEQGLFIYQNANSGLHIQIPLVGAGKEPTCDSLAFPHCPGIFDWPANIYIPTFLPELTFGDTVCIPSYYGKMCTAGLGLKNSFYFRYDQPELITWDQKIVPGIGSCKVNWTFSGNTITSEFIFTVKSQIQLDRMRYILPLGTPHSQYRISSTLCLGEESLRANVLKDDFQASWLDTDVVTDNPEYRSYYGKIHYLQILERNHPLIMRPGQQYRLSIAFDPDITLAGE